MYKEVELFKEPREEMIKAGICQNEEILMSRFDSAFLCGLLKKYLPHKILEIGVANGGTTAILMYCMKMLQLEDCQIYSVDISDKSVTDPNKKTGYIGNKTVEVLKNKINWKLLCGGIALEFIDEIGKDIDFCIIDTSHVLPGEILDFLSVLPYMKKECVVVLHDITRNFPWGMDYGEYKKSEFATRMLLNCVSGEKYLVRDSSAGMYGMPNIAAFKIGADILDNIENVFSCLMMKWFFMPSGSQIELYRKGFREHYNRQCRWIFESAVYMNQKWFRSREKALYDTSIQWLKAKQSGLKIEDFLISNGYHNIAIYGMGGLGLRLYDELKTCSAVNILYGIDKKADEMERTYKVYKPEDKLGPADAIIVTAINDYDEINQKMSYKVDCPCICLEEILQNMLCDEGTEIRREGGGDEYWSVGTLFGR